MSRPVTLFTGQWADLPIEDLAARPFRGGVTQVNGFTGSAVWHLLDSFPPNDFGEIDRSRQEVIYR